ncbi:MAG: hypothetical protein B7Z54_06985, partial [Sphingobacteriales bacterium 12-47-4]
KVLTFSDSSSIQSTKKYYYAKLESLNNSSGGSHINPVFLRTFFSRFACYPTTEPPSCNERTCSHTGWYSSPQNQLNIYPSGVTYGAVVEGFGENFENGAIEHAYTVQVDQGAINMMSGFGVDMIYGSPMINDSYYNGREIEQTIYQKNKLGQLLPVKKLEYTLKIDSRRSIDVRAAAVNWQYEYCTTLPNAPVESAINAFQVMLYLHQSRWVYVDTVKETTFDENGSEAMISYSYYFYDNENHMMPSRTEMKNSLAEHTVVQQKYSLDFGTLTSGDAKSQGIKHLLDNSITTTEIEKSIFKKNADGTNLRLLGSTFTSYKTTIPLPDTIYQVENATPLTDFVAAVNLGGAISIDSRYKKQLSVHEYSSMGNVLEQRKENDIKLAYIWDYKNNYSVAQVNNAEQVDIAYTSFEADGKGNWVFSGAPSVDATAPTGGKAYSLNGFSISKAGLNSSGTYIVSYWSKNGAQTVNSTSSVSGRTVGSWTFYEHKVVNPVGGTITVSGSGTIDELRLYPLNAQMITQTYEPLIGITSQCDALNRITYYEYDAFNRLRLVRDQDKNVIKKIDYQYQQPSN